MLNLCFFLITSNVIAWFTVVPLINKDLSLLDRSSRLTIVHQIFSFRNRLGLCFTCSLKSLSSESKALNEIISLFYPRIDLDEDHSYRDIVTYRQNGQRMLSSLFPRRSSSCRIDKETFQSGDRTVNIYLIRDHLLEHWRNSDQQIILYFHGGGFLFGSDETYFGFECDLSKTYNRLIIHIDHRPLPEQTLTSIIEDSIAVYEYLLRFDSNISRRLIAMGDSSGGMLWIHLLQWLIENKKALPRAVVLHSPWTNLDFTDVSLTITDSPFMSLEMAFTLRRLIIGKGTDWFRLSPEQRAKFSPNNHLFAGFPPIYLTSGTQDIFIDAVRSMAKKIKTSGGEVVLDVSRAAIHAFPLFHRWSPEARCVHEKVRNWIDRQCQSFSTLSWSAILPPKIICKS